jgi:DNA primase
MLVFDKQEIRDSLSIDDVFDLLEEWGGEPERCPTGLIARTICHNRLNDEASRKLYYYENTGLFRCYTGCEDPVFDIFQLCIKVMDLQNNIIYDLNDAVRWIARRFGISGKEEDSPEDTGLEDWKILANYSRIQDIQTAAPHIVLEEYDDTILTRFNYDVKIKPWLDEGISQQAIEHAEIGYYPGDAQITIPHFDKNGRFIGLRGRTLVAEDAERYGKYRPMKINGEMYNHPLGLNLYNFNNSRCVIPRMRKAIVFEGEKSCLLYQTYFGFENDISVACCGSSLSSYQTQLLIDAGAQEIVVAFDRQFQNVGDDEYCHLLKNLKKI